MIYRCIICDKEFTKLDDHSSLLTCSDECKRIYTNKQHSEYMFKRKFSKHPDVCKCLICGKECDCLSKHVSMHGLTSTEYCIKYNVAKESLTSKKHYLMKKELNKGRVTTFHNKNTNPSKNHNGRCSPFSKNFFKYDGLSDQEKEAKIAELKNKKKETMKNNPALSNQHEEFWIDKGYTVEEARQAVKERQQTFSLEICKAKLGEERGLERWKKRQQKWFKGFKKQTYSKISQELFQPLYDSLDDELKEHTYFATKIKDGKNHEYKLQLQDRAIRPDFYIENLKLVIEFNGTYWHGEHADPEHEQARHDSLINAGLIVKYVEEKEFKNDPERILKECQEWIKKQQNL